MFEKGYAYRIGNVFWKATDDFGFRCVAARRSLKTK